jgi:hypothetical protein
MQLDPPEIPEQRPELTGPNPEIPEQRLELTGPNPEAQSQQIIPFVPIQDTLSSMEMQTVPKPQVLSPQRTPSMTKVEGAIEKSATPEVEVHKEAEVPEVQKEPDRKRTTCKDV